MNRDKTKALYLSCDMLVDLVDRLGRSAAEGSRSAGARGHAGAVVAAYRQELSVGLMLARTGMLRDAVERSLDPQAAERQQRARDSYVYRVVHRGPSFYMLWPLHTRNTRHCSSSTSQSAEQSSPAPSPSLARPCRCPVLTDGKS